MRARPLTPPPARHATPTDGASPTPGASPTTSANPAQGTDFPLTDSIAWGSSVGRYYGETYEQALARNGQRLASQVIRVFNRGAPSWPTKTGTTPLVISFKLLPGQVLNGSYDTKLKAFFAATPRPTYWSYWHEPEDNIARGQFTAADYRAAWRHIAALADASGKPLRATLTLMGYTT